MVDALASEYGWGADYILDLPADVTAQLIHALLHRKGVEVSRATTRRDPEAANLQGRLDSIFGQIDNTE